MDNEPKKILVITQATSPIIGGTRSEEVVALRRMPHRFSVTIESGLPSVAEVKRYDLVIVNIDRVAPCFHNRNSFGQEVLDHARQAGLLTDRPFLATTHMLDIAPRYQEDLKRIGVQACIALGVSILGQPMPMLPVRRKEFENHVAEALGLMPAAQAKEHARPQPK